MSIINILNIGKVNCILLAWLTVWLESATQNRNGIKNRKNESKLGLCLMICNSTLHTWSYSVRHCR